MTRRGEILGRGLFDVFPDNPSDEGATGTANLRESLERVLTQGVVDTMAVQKYDIRRPASEGGEFEVRYWSPVNTPVFQDGRVTYIIHRVEDVTEFVELRALSSQHDQLTQELRTHAALMEAEIFRRAQAIQDANRELRQLQAELESRVEARTAELSAANNELTREIAERERAEQALHQSEEQLRQSQKLDAIGRLAGGVAHDFNNMLSVVLSYCELVLSDLRGDDPLREDLLEIQKAGERAAALTRQLLAFGRRQVLEPHSLDLNEIVRGMEKMLARVVGEDIVLVVSAAPELDAVRADQSQIEQMIMNLVINARDAMPKGGQLTIETANVELNWEHAKTHLGVDPGSYAMISVSDTGLGMDRETQARVFEPFFTTKVQGKGTGLGLSTVYGSVKQSGGHIWVYSEPGRGTSVKVYLPRHIVGGHVHSTRHTRDIKDLSGTETILLVEDDDQVRTVGVDILARGGYHAIVARDASEALLICEQYPQQIHLLLSDVVMPRTSGVQLARRLAEIRPDIKVLCMSGYSDEAVLRHGLADSGLEFVQKPFTPEILLRAVRRVLDDK